LIGHTYRVPSFYHLGASVPMALGTAVAFLLFSLAYVAARPRRGMMNVIASRTTGGSVARRLLPLAIIVPWALGALLLRGEQLGLYERTFAVAIFAGGSILIFTALIWWNAKLLYIVDLERSRTERRLAIQHHSTRTLAEASNLSEATPRILQSTCATLDWQVGALWMIDDESPRICCREIWAAEGPP
jgi:hypothetical protein